MEEFDKKYYKIKDVSELLGVSASTLRYWEQEFPECRPRRSATNIRYYKPQDIETLKIIHYLVKIKGLKIDAVRLSHAAMRCLPIIHLQAGWRRFLPIMPAWSFPAISHP